MFSIINHQEQCCGSKYMNLDPDPGFWPNLDQDPGPDPKQSTMSEKKYKI